MKCVAVSDIHTRDVETPPADLLIVGGDMTMKGRSDELQWFTSWLQRQPQKHKVWIAGNHELGVEAHPEVALEIAEKTGTIYLNDAGVEIDGVKIWGSPITPWFMDWAYNRQRGEDIRRHWLLIPEGLDILVTHGPPYGYLDQVRGESVGCEELLKFIGEELKQPPRVHIFGHIHEGYGRLSFKRNDGLSIDLINASICNEHYKAANAPVVFEI